MKMFKFADNLPTAKIFFEKMNHCRPTAARFGRPENGLIV